VLICLLIIRVIVENVSKQFILGVSCYIKWLRKGMGI
jgi:hypothetical protein